MPTARAPEAPRPTQRPANAAKAQTAQTAPNANSRVERLAAIAMEWTIAVACLNLLRGSALSQRLAQEARKRSLRRRGNLGDPLRLDLKSVAQRATPGWHARANHVLEKRVEAAARAAEQSGAHAGLTRDFLAALETSGAPERECLAPSPDTIAAVEHAKAAWLGRYANAIAEGVDWNDKAANAAEDRKAKAAAEQAEALDALEWLEQAAHRFAPESLGRALAAGAFEKARAADATRHRELFVFALRAPKRWPNAHRFERPMDLRALRDYHAILDALAPLCLAEAMALAAQRPNGSLWSTLFEVGRPALLWAIAQPPLLADPQLSNMAGRAFAAQERRDFRADDWTLLDRFGPLVAEWTAREWMRAAPADSMPMTRDRLLQLDQAAIAEAAAQGLASSARRGRMRTL
jgi:hypothetical protein